jgi:general secretion pathway protein D
MLCLAAAVALAGCATPPTTLEADNGMLREALDGTGDQRAPIDPRIEAGSEPIAAQPQAGQTGASTASTGTRQIIRGTQRFVKAPAAGAAVPQAAEGDIVFNFANQPIEAVVNSILGDMLHESYTIAQGVKGEVSFSTSRPVNPQQALSILETLLSWTDNAMIRQGNRYVILPASQAIAGKLVPEMAVAQPSAGLSARLFPLRYISATEMQKLLKPFARENAFLLVDPARNVLSLAGTAEELANYQRTIDTFDVDWLKGMSVGVFGLQRASVSELMPELQKLFGPDSGMPLAGMVRFLPIERTNSVVAFSSQPEYLNEVGTWIRTIDEGGGNEPQLYVYDVRNMKATDLAKYLKQIYGTGAVREEAAAKVAPGLRTRSMSSLTGGTSGGVGAGTGMSSGSGSGLSGGAQSGMSQNGMAQSTTGADDEPEQEADASSDAGSDDGSGSNTGATGTGQKGLDATTRISAQKSSNQLLVRTRPAQWKEIEAAIKRLDNAPLQVQIETRILEVKLTGELDQGVQWYLGRLAGNSASTTVANTPGSQGALGGGGAGLGASDSLFYSFVSTNLQVAIHALETNGRTQVLSAPSLVVMNNENAQIQVGDNIPISQTTVNTGTSNTTLSSVEYLQTGVILNVVPRINPGGLVYMDIQQQVSDADGTVTVNGNPRISTRSVSTQVAAQSGQTVLLGGLIKQDNSESVSAVPYLGRVPGLGWLFGNRSKSKDRTELLVLITPRVINSGSQARQVTDDYRQQMQLLNTTGAPQALR